MSNTDRVRAALLAGPMRLRALETLLDAKLSANVGRLHAWREIHIVDWYPTGRLWVAVYALGDRKDKERPKPKSQAQRTREWRHRQNPPIKRIDPPKDNATMCRESRELKANKVSSVFEWAGSMTL